MADPADAARDLLRHVDPHRIEDALFETIKLNRDITDDLLSTVDVPLKVGTDSKGNQYILCDYNRDADSYRSPFTNEYKPSVKSGNTPPKHLREIEILANKGFQSYLHQYFDTGVISCYAWEVDDNSWGLGVFIAKTVEPRETGLQGSIWCSDVCQVTKIKGTQFSYNLVSSAIVTVQWGGRTPVRLSGNVNDQRTVEGNAGEPIDHLVTIGTVLEESADRFVERIRGIYVSRMKEILLLMKTDMEGVTEDATSKLASGLKK
jgi:capping protein beta